MATTIEKLRALRRIGAERVADEALVRVIQSEVERIGKEQKRLKTILEKFERKYGMTSNKCQKQFESGQLGDNADFFEWMGVYKIYKSNETSIRILKDKISE